MVSVVALHEKHVVIGKDFWTEASTGDWGTDCNTGRWRAERYVTRLNNTPESIPLFLHSMREIVEKSQWTGVEVGFFQRIIELAMTGWDARK